MVPSEAGNAARLYGDHHRGRREAHVSSPGVHRPRPDQGHRRLAETEIAFFAQDNDGNVWLLGEYPEEWEAGKFVKAPAWLHGREDARAGIAMKAKPQVGAPSYAQGWGPAVKWTDRATVDQMGQKTCVRKGC